MPPKTSKRLITAAAIVSLSRLFDKPVDPYSQDWQWEVADPSQFENFLGTYRFGDLDEDERFALMEVLIQCIEDMNLPSVESSPQWHAVADLLCAQIGLHIDSVRYWSCLDDRAIENCFLVTGPMRVILDALEWSDDGGQG